jgi:phosphoribosylanthranilate isomerase
MKLKICGVRSPAEAKALRGLNVDYAGINFIPSSSRYIASLEAAEPILNEFKNSGVETVGLFAGRPAAEVNEYAQRLKLDYVQLHGNEPADYAKAVEASVIRAIAVNPSQPVAELLEFINQFPADYFVLDRQKQGQGDLVSSELANQIITANLGRIFLAGGLNPDNLAGVISQTQPYGIDIAGGVRDSNDNLDISKAETCLQIIAKV